jgi:hypothetical protein
MSDDFATDFRDERRWRKALKLVGRSEIQEYLHRYPGHPDDPVSDLPVDPPFPTREFCEQWLLADTQTIKAYRSLIFIFAAGVLFALSYASCTIGNMATPPPIPSVSSTGTPSQLMNTPPTAAPLSPPPAPPLPGTTATPSPSTLGPPNRF